MMMNMISGRTRSRQYLDEEASAYRPGDRRGSASEIIMEKNSRDCDIHHIEAPGGGLGRGDEHDR